MDVTMMATTTANGTTTDTARFEDYVGYIACFITCCLFGTYFIPVKKFEAGDGVFFQWVQCCAIATYGVFFNIIIGTPKFEPLAMVGGVMWCTGNLVCVVCVRLLGLGMGQNMWSLVGMLLGWAADRFGWFGKAKVPTIEWLQYLGIALSVVRGVLAALIEPSYAKPNSSVAPHTPAEPTDNYQLETAIVSNGNDDTVTMTSAGRRNRNEEVEENTNQTDKELEASAPNGQATSSSSASGDSGSESENKPDFIDSLPTIQKRILGVGLATFAGINFGFQFSTITVLKGQGGSQYDMDYSFAFYCGTFTASTIYTVIYALAKRNRPFVNQQLIAPASLSGLMWVLAQTGWFIANEALSQSVTFPIMAAGPALVSLAIGFLVFHEIQGKKNIILLAAVAVITVASVLMVAFSM